MSMAGLTCGLKLSDCIGQVLKELDLESMDLSKKVTEINTSITQLNEGIM